MTRLPIVLLFVAVVLMPATASAVTVQEIVALSKAGVADEVIIALINRDKGVFSIEAAQLEELKIVGVSPAVVLAMLQSGLQAQAQPTTPAGGLVADGPQLVIVGHGPDVPNASATQVYVTPFRFVVPYVVGSVAGRGACAGTVENQNTAASNAAPVPAPPFGRFMNDPMVRFTNNGFIATRSAPGVPNCQPPSAQPRVTTPRPRR